MTLKEYLSANTLAATEFGRRIGVSQAAVTRYVSGARIPEPQIMRRIVEATAGSVMPNDFYDLPPSGQTNEGLMEEAHAFGTDVETTSDRTLHAASIDARRRRWRHENREAIAAANTELTEQGLWSDGLRLF